MNQKVEPPVQDDWDGVEGGLIHDGSEENEESTEDSKDVTGKRATEDTDVEQEQRGGEDDTEESEEEQTESGGGKDEDVDIEALRTDAEKWRHMQSVAEKNPADFADILKKHFPGRKSPSAVELDTKVIFNKDPDKTYTEEEIITHINEANRSMVDKVLHDRGLSDLLQQHHERRLEEAYPFYKEGTVKKTAREYQEKSEIDPSGTFQEVFIKAAAFDNMGDVVKTGEKIAQIRTRQKRAATGEKGAKPPETRRGPQEKESTAEQRAVASIMEVSPWGD